VDKKEFQYNLDLIKAFDSNLKTKYNTPVLKLNINRENIVIFHIGFGGSSDGNLSFNQYLTLAKQASIYSDVIFTFGPDDNIAKEYIIKNLNFKATIKDDFKNIYEFSKFIASSSLFISTSTGPMHLAGVSNTPTISFFGESNFASSSRWATISDANIQHNFNKPFEFDDIEKCMVQLLKDKD
jgi:ADP-heptose:LPS heptosyltransferase